MKNAKDHPENLGVRARRGALLPGELAELTEVLGSSPELRAAYELGRDFDRIAAVQSGDEERLARFVSAALETRKPRLRARTRAFRVSWLAAAAVFVVCGVAFAVRAVWTPRTPPATAPASAPSPASGRTRHVPTLGEANAEPPPPLPAVDSAQPQNAAPTPSSVPVMPARNLDAHGSALNAPSTPSLPSTPSPPVSAEPTQHEQASAAFALVPPSEPGAPNAAALLRAANAARGTGDLALTSVLLEELEQQFPGSPEAHVALVSLGKLQLLRGAPGAALERFSGYLSNGGPLEEEALVGRAQALGMLSRSTEERATWQTLLVRFPGSVYAAQARERLSALAAGATE
ncbi:MAG TPA: hypothetical protein VGI10_07670 [Polyangiaceae bacterium]|jgi:TolA-binding protein